MKQKQRIKGIIFAITAAIMWAGMGVMVQIMTQIGGLSPLWLMSIRMLFAGIIFFVMNIIRDGLKVFDVFKNARDVIALVFFALAGNGMMGIAYFYAIETSNVATATILEELAPAVIILGSIVIKRKMPTVKEVICLFLALIGTFLIGTHGHFGNVLFSKYSLIWGLTSAVALAIYTAFPIKLMKKYSISNIIGWSMMIVGVLLSAYTRPIKECMSLSLINCVFLLGIIVFGTVIPFILYSLAVIYIGAAEASMLETAEPLTSAIASYFLFEISFSLPDYLGFACILGITVILSLKSK